MSNDSSMEQENRVGPTTEGSGNEGEGTAEGVEDTTAASKTDDELPQDLVFDALKNSRRRQVLRHLDERGGRVRLGELAEHIAAIENDTTTAALDSDQRKRVYVGLYQCHLPRLDDMDIVDFNQSRGHVELGPAARHLEKHLYIDEERGNARYPYYVAFGAASAVIMLAGVLTGLLGAASAAALLAMQGSAALALTAIAALDRRD